MSTDMHKIESLLQQSRDRTKAKGRHRVSVCVTFEISKQEEDYLLEQFMSAESGEPTMAKIIQEMWPYYRPLVVMREETEEFFFEIWDAASGRILEISRYNQREEKFKEAVQAFKRSLQVLRNVEWVAPKQGSKSTWKGTYEYFEMLREFYY
jgi:hypothetical protein